MYVSIIIVIKTSTDSLVKTQPHKIPLSITITKAHLIIIAIKKGPIGTNIKAIINKLLFDSLFNFMFDDLFAL